MRTIVLFIAFLGLSTISAQTTTQVDSKISDVVVYLRGAQITRQASVTIPAGRSNILLTGLTARLNSNSLQVSTEKGVTILSVNHGIDHLQQANTDARIEKLMKRHDNLKDSIELIKNTREVSLKERDMLLSNQSIGGQESGVNVEQLIRATNFFRERLTEIEKTLFGMQQKIDDMQERLNRLNRQLNVLNAKKNIPSSTVKIALAANNRQSTRMSLTYTVDQARWQPEYDIRVDDINDPLNLVYKAKVFQNTDEKWNNVNLTLSTGNPSISNDKPELQPWFLDFIKPKPLKSHQSVDSERDFEVVQFASPSKKSPLLTRGTAALGRENVTTTQQQTTTSFRINIPYTIPSDNKGYDVAVTDHQLDADYQYATAPKLSPHVYLLARVTNWSNLNLLPGGASIYFAGTYQGKTRLDPYTSEDTLNVSIGRDPGIIVSRELLKDFSSKSFLGNNRKETKAWKITVRNTKNTTANLIVEDQYPVSSNSDIKIDLEESSGAEVNPTTGILNWQLELDPGETKEIRMVYSVRYPKDQVVVVE